MDFDGDDLKAKHLNTDTYDIVITCRYCNFSCSDVRIIISGSENVPDDCEIQDS